MDLTEEKINAVVSTLYKARTDSDVKLRHGARRRLEIVDKVREGDDSFKDDYRYQWLKQTRNNLFALLIAEAKLYAAKYPHDMISTQDTVDVAEALLMFVKTPA